MRTQVCPKHLRHTAGLYESLFCIFAGRKWRLMGELAVSRSLGDLPYITKGLIAEPDIASLDLAAGWGTGSAEFLILASDGLFETVSAAEACAAAHDLAAGKPVQLHEQGYVHLPFFVRSSRHGHCAVRGLESRSFLWYL